jgi:hypothetical protein
MFSMMIWMIAGLWMCRNNAVVPAPYEALLGYYSRGFDHA